MTVTVGRLIRRQPHDDSALALKTIVGTFDVAIVDLLYGGEISHQQNRAFVNLFEVDLEPLDTEALAASDTVAFVDHAIPGQHATVPTGSGVDIVVDQAYQIRALYTATARLTRSESVSSDVRDSEETQYFTKPVS